jgi:hypothetical protein
MAGSFGENVDEKIPEIEQHPFGVALAFAMLQPDADLRQLLFDLFADGVHLPRAEAGAEQKSIGKCAESMKIEQRDFRRLLFLRGGDSYAKPGL